MHPGAVYKHEMVLFLLWVAGACAQEGSLISYTITEEDAPGTTLGNVVNDSSIKDRYPTEVLSVLRFSFLEQDETPGNEHSGSNLFIIDNEGQLQTRYRIDREGFCAYKQDCTISLDVQVQPSQYFQILKIQVEILDVNDNAPQFPNSFIKLALSEASVVGSILTLPLADDKDSPMFGVVGYSLAEGNPAFQLKVKENDGSRVVQLIQKETLDRELKASYSMKLKAVDGGSPSKKDIATVYIEVVDVNDNPTIFEQESYEVSIPESTRIYSRILRVRATDADTSGSSGLIYGLGAQTVKEYEHIFKVENVTGYIIVIGTLDYETKNEYTLDVTAQDRTPGAIPTVAKVIIRVLDINDNAPKIKLNSLTSTGHAQISEFATKGSFVAHITINDLDSGGNGQFDCSLNNDFFELEKMFPTEFKLITKVIFNRESKADYEVTISCTDRGSSPLTNKKSIPVTILDENDNAPVFSPTSYTTSILENTVVGVSILQVYAQDADFGDNALVKYQLDPEGQKYLSIDEDTGNITTRISLDHEKLQQLQVKVYAHDLGSPSQTGTATVRIDIIDQDDELPEFMQKHYTFVVHENEPSNTAIGQVEALDKDSEPFSQFKYGLKSGNGVVIHDFKIDEGTGMLYTKRDLDREQGSVYYVTVLAITESIKPSTSSASVTIYVADKNDHVPEIIFPNPRNDTVYVPSSLPQGEAITQIQAIDNDSGSNAHLLYSIQSGNELGHFVMDTSSGFIFVGSHLEMTEEFKVFQLTVKVQDGGVPPKTAEAILNVIVNRSHPIGGNDLVPQENLTIVIVIACMSGLLVVILTVAIVAIVRQQRRKNIQRYNNMAHNIHPTVVIEPSNQAKDENIANDIDILVDNTTKDGISVVYPKRKKQRHKSQGDKNNSSSYDTSRAGASDFEKDEGDRRKKKEVSFAVNAGLEVSEEDIKLKQPLSIQTGHIDLPGEDQDSGCSMDTSQADSGQGSTGSDDLAFEAHPSHQHVKNNQRLNNNLKDNHRHHPRSPQHHQSSKGASHLHRNHPSHHQHHPSSSHHHHRQFSHDSSLPASPVIRTKELKPGYSGSHGNHFRNSFHGGDAEKPALPPRENRKRENARNISQMFARDILYKDLQKPSSVPNPNNLCRVHGLPSTTPSPSVTKTQNYTGSSSSVNLHEISGEVHV